MTYHSTTAAAMSLKPLSVPLTGRLSKKALGSQGAPVDAHDILVLTRRFKTHANIYEAG